MNTYLKELFEKYNISDRDRHEISQVFSVLSDERKKNLLNNFPALAGRISQIKNEIEKEREILLGKSMEKIKDAILIWREENFSWVRKELDLLKEEIQKQSIGA